MLNALRRRYGVLSYRVVHRLEVHQHNIRLTKIMPMPDTRRPPLEYRRQVHCRAEGLL
jgi:hypothetical protein